MTEPHTPAAPEGDLLVIAALHLIPGALALPVYGLLARPVQALGHPSVAAWIIAAAVVLVPLELGWLYYLGHRRNGRLSLEGIVLYRRELGAGELVKATAGILGVILLFSLLTAPLGRWLRLAMFDWIPLWFVLDRGIGNPEIGSAALTLVNVTGLVVLVFGLAVTEELYFRGYLLPRLERLGGWAVPFHSFLYALYHFVTPWRIITYTLFALPITDLTRRTGSILPAIVAHAVVSGVSVAAGFAYLLSR